jgi:hypothetical protein
MSAAFAKPSIEMPSDKTIILKQVLRDEGLPALAKLAPYFSTEALAAWLRRRKLACPPKTLNRYLHEFRRAGLIYDAGRGWYSSLATPFILDREPISSLVQELRRAFPLVEFSCWSTEQVKGAMHHLLSRFVTVINVEADSMQSVWEYFTRRRLGRLAESARCRGGAAVRGARPHGCRPA